MKAIFILTAVISLAACTYNDYGPVPDYTNVQVDAEHRAWADGLSKTCVAQSRAQAPSRAMFSDGEVSSYCTCVSSAIAMALTPEDMRYFMGHNEYPDRIRQMVDTPKKQCRAKVVGS